MNQPKPILTIKQKCRECDGIKIIIDKSVEKDMQMKAGVYVCKSCKGTGQQTTEIYALRDFKDKNKKSPFYYKIIPFKDYEIKKVSEITQKEWIAIGEPIMVTHNLKEDDKLVVRVK